MKAIAVRTEFPWLAVFNMCGVLFALALTALMGWIAFYSTTTIRWGAVFGLCIGAVSLAVWLTFLYRSLR